MLVFGLVSSLTSSPSQRTTRDDPVRLLHRAIDMVSPSIRMVTLRRSAKNIPVPSALDARQRSRQGIQWILKAAERGRAGGQPRNGRLAREIMSVLEGTSSALQRKDEVHRLATVNRSVPVQQLDRFTADQPFALGRICRRDNASTNTISLVHCCIGYFTRVQRRRKQRDLG